jgi:hypothetical protein
VQLVRLRTGKEVPDVLVSTTMLSLKTLLNEHPIAFYELVMLCRDENHVCFGNSGMWLQGEGLIEANGRPHECVQDIVLAAAEGEGLALALRNPLAEQPPETAPTARDAR